MKKGQWWTLSFILSLFQVTCSSELKFAGWGQVCKVPDASGMEVLDPKYECDAGRGLSCQTYTQGQLCGCSGHALSYDRQSEECRRKVGTACHQPKDKSDVSHLSFNHKCHERAECVIYTGTLLGGETERKKDSKPVCLCKQGYLSTVDHSECRDPNGTTSLHSSVLLLLPALLSYTVAFLLFS